MGFVRLVSSNPKLSYVIKKNPTSGMIMRKLRKGTVFGWYSKEDTYNIFFEDSLIETSYNTGDYEYLDTTRYSSAVMIMNSIEELLASVRRQKAEDDGDNFQNKLFINALQINKKKICDSFMMYFKGEYDAQITEIAHKCYRVELSTTKSLHDLLNYTMFFCLMAAIANRERVEADDQYIQKHLNVINNIDAPYYLRYSFAKSLIKTKKQFLKFKPLLDSSKRYESLHLSFGDTAKQRLYNLLEKLSFKNPIVDIGCNVGHNAIVLAKKLETLPYYAIDVDEGALASLQKKMTEENVTNITSFVGLESLLESGVLDTETKYDVLLTEVVEHMSVEEAEKLIKQVLDNINFNTFTITTPNKNFNIHYFEGEQMRHHDHKWEMKVEEFNAWMEKILPKDKKKEFFGTGCEVNRQFLTCGVVVSQ